jgi:hypothetical protein
MTGLVICDRFDQGSVTEIDNLELLMFQKQQVVVRAEDYQVVS